MFTVVQTTPGKVYVRVNGELQQIRRKEWDRYIERGALRKADPLELLGVMGGDSFDP